MKATQPILAALLAVGTLCATSAAMAGRGADGINDKFTGLRFEEPKFQFRDVSDPSQKVELGINRSYRPGTLALPVNGKFSCNLRSDVKVKKTIAATSILWSGASSDGVTPQVVVTDGTTATLLIYIYLARQGSNQMSGDDCTVSGELPLSVFNQQYQNNLNEIAQRQNFLLGQLRSVTSATQPDSFVTLLLQRDRAERLVQGYIKEMSVEPFTIDPDSTLILPPYAMSQDLSPLVPEANTYRLVHNLTSPTHEGDLELLRRFQWDDLVAAYHTAIEYDTSKPEYTAAREGFRKIGVKYGYDEHGIEWAMHSSEYARQYQEMASALNLK